MIYYVISRPKGTPMTIKITTANKGLASDLLTAAWINEQLACCYCSNVITVEAGMDLAHRLRAATATKDRNYSLVEGDADAVAPAHAGCHRIATARRQDDNPAYFDLAQALAREAMDLDGHTGAEVRRDNALDREAIIAGW